MSRVAHPVLADCLSGLPELALHLWCCDLSQKPLGLFCRYASLLCSGQDALQLCDVFILEEEDAQQERGGKAQGVVEDSEPQGRAGPGLWKWA